MVHYLPDYLLHLEQLKLKFEKRRIIQIQNPKVNNKTISLFLKLKAIIFLTFLVFIIINKKHLKRYKQLISMEINHIKNLGNLEVTNSSYTIGLKRFII